MEYLWEVFKERQLNNVFIQTEETPNPNSLKFLPGQPVLADGQGPVTFEKNSSIPSPLARQLLAVEGVDSVFFGADFITITKAQAFDWYVLKPLLLGTMMDHFVHEIPLFSEPKKASSEPNDDPIIRQICELLDTRVRPAVAQDGGDIEFDRFEDGILYLNMRGACSGCPSSTATLKSGIENMLRFYVPEVLEVRQNTHD
jgi:Fe-S cluster biogenesis protein NfuA